MRSQMLASAKEPHRNKSNRNKTRHDKINLYRTAKERHAHTHISRTSTIVFIIRLGRHHSVSAGTSSSSCVTVQEFHKRAKQIAAPAILPFDTNLFGKMPCIS
mmetsp:Transcript_22124/g.48129  ORF Transcript_22124/g.48129 Transcript_22124/m.48129 type:complete len:103 (+) Transcript_22124:784-1092(+)